MPDKHLSKDYISRQAISAARLKRLHTRRAGAAPGRGAGRERSMGRRRAFGAPPSLADHGPKQVKVTWPGE